MSFTIDKEIEEIGNPVYAISQLKEKRIITKIMLDLPDFLEFIRDNKGLSISDHEADGFTKMKKFMNL